MTELQQFDVRLDSPVKGDRNFRVMTVAAENEDAARDIAHRQEHDLVAFAVTDPVAPGQAGDSVEITARLEEEGQARAQQLSQLESALTIGDDGRVTGGRARDRALLHAHRQEKPYRVMAVERVTPNVDQLIRGLAQLHGDKQAWKRMLAELEKQGIPLGVVTASLFGLQSQKQIDGSAPIVWSTATMKVALTTSAWTPDQDAHDFFNDVTNEITGTGYTAGGATLGTKTSTYDTATDTIRLDAADTTWTTSTLTARRAVVWSDTAGASSTDPLWGWVDFGADFSTTAGTFQITWDTTGIIVFDVT